MAQRQSAERKMREMSTEFEALIATNIAAVAKVEEARKQWRETAFSPALCDVSPLLEAYEQAKIAHDASEAACSSYMVKVTVEKAKALTAAMML